MTKDYNSADRYLLKVFLDTCANSFKQLLNMDQTIQDSARLLWNSDNQIKVPFFLQVYESHFSTRIEHDKYDIKEYINSNEAAQGMLDKYGLRERMESCEVLELIRVSPPDVKSRHVIICAHGFLMQNDDVNVNFGEVAKYYKYCEVYAIRWTSTAIEHFLNMGVFSKGINTIISKVQRAADFYNTGKKQFEFAYHQGNLAGYLLAYFLLNSDFAEGKAVSLLAYSAGSVLAFHCCEGMRAFYSEGFKSAGRILHDMQLWAGSFVVDPNRKFEERM